MNKFHLYVTTLRKRQFKNTSKLCKLLSVDKSLWRKIERGINPPPKRSLLKKFCHLVLALSYEETHLYALAKRWEPHADTNTANHVLLDHHSKSEWKEAILEQNKPDYPHKYWK